MHTDSVFRFDTMMGHIALYFREAWVNVRYVDVLDVLVVAALTYAVVTWFRTARSRFVLTGMGALAGLYAIARALDMYLTLLLFQAAIAVALFALVVIFQEEIRRAFERLGSSRPPWRAKTADTAKDTLEAVVVAATTLAKQKSGALIVLKGSEPLERHLTGGFDLDGRVTVPLLLSIFDTSSPGHDGAVIVEDDTLIKFGVHLPLSTDPREGDPAGTRHSAGLGLSEQSNALVIIVSEERGTISIAQDGTIGVVSPTVLRSRVQAFARALSPQVHPRGVTRRLLRHPGTKAASVAIAVSAWLVLFGSHGNVVARTFVVPISYCRVPDGWFLEEPKPLKVSVTLSGTNRVFQQHDMSSLAICVDVSHIRAGSQKITLDEQELALPPRVTFHSITPQFVTIVGHEAITREVPVKAHAIGRLPNGLVLKSVQVTPSTVPIVMRKADEAMITRLLTDPIDLASIAETQRLARTLDLPNGTRLPGTTPTTVEVLVEVAPSTKK